jgi:threonine/homoserine/homoserine lactone efflux protein
MPLPFALSVALILAVPGPTNTLLSASGGTKDLRHAASLIAAEVLAYLTAIAVLRVAGGWATAVVPGLAPLLQASIAAYLLVLAWQLWKSGTVAAAAESPVGVREIFLVTLANPKALVFAYGIFPAVLDGMVVAQHALVFALTTAAVATAWILIGMTLRRGLLTRGAVHFVPRIAATVILVFATGAAGAALAML